MKKKKKLFLMILNHIPKQNQNQNHIPKQTQVRMMNLGNMKTQKISIYLKKVEKAKMLQRLMCLIKRKKIISKRK